MKINEKSFKCMIYHRPRGNKELIDFKSANEEDIDYINNKKIKVSIEEDSISGFIMYFDYGKKVNDDHEEEPDELIILSGQRNANDTIKEAVIKLKELI